MLEPIAPASRLGTFIAEHREELIGRCIGLVANRPAPALTNVEAERGIPLLLDRLVAALGHEPSMTRAFGQDATQHGQALFFQGFTISQVVHDYGAVCQAVTGLAVDLAAPVSVDDFRTLNLCLDEAIAGAVTQYSRQQRIANDDRSINQSLALQNMLFVVSTAFQALRGGNVGTSGATGDLIERTLTAMHERLSTP